MEKKNWTEPEVTEIDIADETQLDGGSNNDAADPVGMGGGGGGGGGS